MMILCVYVCVCYPSSAVISELCIRIQHALRIFILFYISNKVIRHGIFVRRGMKIGCVNMSVSGGHGHYVFPFFPFCYIYILF